MMGYYIVSIISPRIWLVTFSIPLLKAFRVEADKDVEVDSVQDPFYLGVALLLQEEGGKLQQHLVLMVKSTNKNLKDNYYHHHLPAHGLVAMHVPHQLHCRLQLGTGLAKGVLVFEDYWILFNIEYSMC